MRIGRRIKVAVRFPFSYCQSSNIAINSSKESRNVNLKDYKISFQHKTNISLVKSLLVFSACKVPFLVNNAEELLKLSRKIFGEGFTKIVLKASFFGQFCAGEDENSIKPTIQKLEIAGIGSILDYAAESDVPIDSNKSKDFKTVQCRVYDYSNEELCDFHTEIFSKCIRSVKAVSPTGFAAIKCTALGNPELLKRVSVTLNELKNLFLKLDKEKTGFVCRDDFLKTFGAVINGQNSLSYFDSIDSDKDGKIDYIEWTNGLDILELHNLTEYCTERGPLFASVLNPEERVLFANMKRRLHSLASLAKSEGVRIMIDAEQTYFQPAIDNLTYSLSKQFNGTVDKTSHPVVFSTYQMYLKDTAKRLTEDVARARKGGYVFAAKLVRGAYMDLERSLAAEAGRSDPVHDSIQQTHLAYDQAVRFILQQIADGQKLEVMIATHNSQSVENAMHLMEVRIFR